MNTAHQASQVDATQKLQAAIQTYKIADLNTILNDTTEWQNASGFTKSLGTFIARPDIAQEPLGALVHWLACSHATTAMMADQKIAESRLNYITLATSLVSRILQAVEIKDHTSPNRSGVSDTRSAAFQPRYASKATRLTDAFVTFLRTAPHTEPSLLNNATLDNAILHSLPSELPPILPPEEPKPTESKEGSIRPSLPRR